MNKDEERRTEGRKRILRSIRRRVDESERASAVAVPDLITRYP